MTEVNKVAQPMMTKTFTALSRSVRVERNGHYDGAEPYTIRAADLKS